MKNTPLKPTLFAILLGLITGMTVSVMTPVSADESAPAALPLEDLQRFTSVLEHIRSYYVKPTDDGPLFENAIRGMLSSLDPHSTFLNPEEFDELKEDTAGKFGGLGIEVTMEEGFIRVISPIDNTPATEAGIKAGDLIIRLDDVPVKGLSLRKAVDMMRGEPGTKIELMVIRDGEAAPLHIDVTRDIIEVESIRAKMLDDGFGYIRVSQFQNESGKQLRLAVNELLDESPTGELKGLVLDLRNNPGGVFEASVEISDTFLDSSDLQHDRLIVYTEGRLPGSVLQERAHKGDLLNGAPIVVLINEGSASASEIVAGALQDHKRAVLMGTPSFGKGSVQTVLPLEHDYGLKITTALYFTPSGRSIQAKGIEPDITVKPIPMPEQQTASTWAALRESDLKGHLDNAMIDELLAEDSAKDSPYEPITDYQINEALNLLKGLAILSPTHKG